VTAPDARPPSDETRETGWHRHRRADGVHVVRDDECPCGNAQAYVDVLVVDPAGAREKIARALAEHGGWDWDLLLDHKSYRDLVERYYLQADAVLAALTTPEPPQVEDIVDGWVQPGGGPA
jgi:hypothetical protein